MLCTVYYYISKMLVGELMHVCVVMSTYYILLNNEDFEPLSELFFSTMDVFNLYCCFDCISLSH